MSEVEIPIVGVEKESDRDAISKPKSKRPTKVSDDVLSVFVDGIRFSVSGKAVLKIGLFEVIPFGSGEVVSRVNVIATMTAKTAAVIGRRLVELANDLEPQAMTSKEDDDAKSEA